ncbi:LOW QUALITY PROTEIN: hypothetical protein V2J09_016254 [Rumex salicifolius]
MEDCKPICSLVKSGSHLVYEGDPMSDPHMYCSVVGAIQYPIITRPELIYVSVSIHASTERDSLGFCQMHSLREYRLWQPDLAKTLAWSYFRMSAGHPMVMVAHNTVMLYIILASKKQHVVAKSSSKADYWVIAFVVTELVCINQLL